MLSSLLVSEVYLHNPVQVATLEFAVEHQVVLLGFLEVVFLGFLEVVLVLHPHREVLIRESRLETLIEH